MPYQTLLIIRHAEKPDDGSVQGVDATGVQDGRSLTPRGWQRAGVWAELFAPSSGQAGLLPKPATIFASAPASHHELALGVGGSKSRRPLETVSPLADKLGIAVDQSYSKGDERDLAAAIAKTTGVILVCWQHEDIRAIADALTPQPAGVPGGWPGDRFNAVFRFVRADERAEWTFDQLSPVLLKGDSSAAI
jgi:broad specificity phosphatase PhoE